MSMPIIGQPKSTVKMPPMKNPVAFSLCRWKKKRKVRSKPMMNAKPLMKRIFPIARSPLSNRNKTPNVKNEIPKPVRPMPIFCKSVTSIILNTVRNRGREGSFIYSLIFCRLFFWNTSEGTGSTVTDGGGWSMPWDAAEQLLRNDESSLRNQNGRCYGNATPIVSAPCRRS